MAHRYVRSGGLWGSLHFGTKTQEERLFSVDCSRKLLRDHSSLSFFHLWHGALFFFYIPIEISLGPFFFLGCVIVHELMIPSELLYT